MSENSLVAGPTDSSWHQGAGILDSGLNLASEVTSGEWDGLALGMGGLAFGLDALQMAMNPAQELMKAGVGFLLELIPGVTDLIELLTGDPNAIEGVAQSWNNVAEHLDGVAEDHEASLSKVSGWSGDAAIQYREVAEADIAALRKLAGEARSAAQGVTVLGVLAATARGIVVDLLAEWITDRIRNFLIASSLSPFTFGGAQAVFMSESAISAVNLMNTINSNVKKFLSAIADTLDSFGIIGKRIVALAESLDEFLNTGTDLAQAAAAAGLTAVKENAAAWSEQGDQLSGGSKDDGMVTAAPAADDVTHQRTQTGGRISGRIDDGA